MISQPNRFVLAGGLLIGALAIAALGVRLSINGFSGHSAARDDVSISTPPDAAPTRAVRAQPGPTSTSDAGIAYILQAVHDSLQRNDLASAKVLLDAVLAIRSDEPQALILQKELIKRQEQTRAATAVASAGPAPNAAEPVRSTPRATDKAERAHDNSPHATRERPTTAARHGHTQNTQRNEVAAFDATRAEAVRPVHASDAMLPVSGPTVSSTIGATPPAAASPVVHPAPQVSNTTAQAAAPASTDIAPPIQTAQSNPAPAVYGQAPKTRAEVRDELSRARADGSLSRFGNPDPKGPGGTPSYNAQPSVKP